MAGQRCGHRPVVAAGTGENHPHAGDEPLCAELGSLLEKPVDLINLRIVSTVFQKEIIAADRRIHTGNAYAADEFEMLVLSFYQKLSQERAEILAEGLRSGRFYSV